MPSVSFPLRLTPASFLAVVALFIALHPCLAAPADPDAAPPIQPTVTVEMGDVGGKYFGAAPDPAKTRHYYIAAEPVLWDFAPLGKDPICGKRFPSTLLLNRHSWKVRYVQYADPEFRARVLPADRLGILGPVLRGVTGEHLAVTFLNRSWLPLSMHPHGVRYDKDSEGTMDQPSPGLGAAVAPGAKFTYVWKLDEASGPRPEDPSSKAWLYHSHVAGDEEINLGLIGFIVVTDPARARADGTPKDVDREMAGLFTIFDESFLGDGDGEDEDERPPDGSKKAPVPHTWAEIQQASEEGERLTINGLTFGNLPGLEMNQGEHVRWYMFGLGSENDFHTAHWHGLRITEDGGRRVSDVVELLPGSMKIADMVADNPGSWLMHCHVAEHMQDGMYARVIVHPPGESEASRDPEVAFFGTPKSLQTLRFTSAETAFKGDAGAEIYLDGQVTVPDPFPSAKTPVSVQIGGKTITLQPDANGLSISPEGILLIKNSSMVGNGIVKGGLLKFELTLKGPGWLEELRNARAVEAQSPALAPDATLPVTLLVGPVRHTATTPLKIAAP